MNDQIVIKGARLHNLKNVSLSLPKNKLIVFTGLSGSGKSTLAFDTLHKEGARQYMESLGLVTDGMSKAPVESDQRAFSIDQRRPAPDQPQPALHGGHRDRNLHLSAGAVRPPGQRPCPHCGDEISPEIEALDENCDGRKRSDEDDGVACPHCGARLPELSMASFSFNKPAGACPTCTGLGVVADLLVERIFDPSRSVLDDGVVIWDRLQHRALRGDPAARRAALWLRLRPAPADGRIGRGAARSALLRRQQRAVHAPLPGRQAARHGGQGPFRGGADQPEAPLRRRAV